MRNLHGLFSRDYQTFDQNHHQITTIFIRPPALPSILHFLPLFHLAMISVLTAIPALLLVIIPSTINQSPSILN